MESSVARSRFVSQHRVPESSRRATVCSNAPQSVQSSTMYLLKTQIRNFLVRKYIIILIVLLVLTGFTICYINKKHVFRVEPSIMYLGAVEQNNISCHFINDGDVLPSADDASFSSRSDSIFFHETSCRGGLNSRQACAVESAARAHPTRQVYVLFSSPVSHDAYYGSCIAKLMNSFPNVQFARVHIADYVKNTPLESFVASNPFEGGGWQVEHSSDVLRFLTLYKFGGIYLDTDILVVKPLTPLGPTWLSREDTYSASNAAIAITKDQFGRELAEDFFNELKATNDQHIWANNGPGVITRVLRRRCNTEKLEEMSAETCQGLKVFPPEYLYPIHYTMKDDYFNPGEIEDNDYTYAHHLWNHVTRYQKVEKDSLYAKMAKRFCPTIYEMYGDKFGE